MSDEATSETPEEVLARKRARPRHVHLYDAAEQLLALAATHHGEAQDYANKIVLDKKDEALRRAHAAAKARGDALLAQSKKLRALAQRYESAA